MGAIKDASPLYEVERRAEHAARPGFRITELQLSASQKVPWHTHTNVADTFYVPRGRAAHLPAATEGGSAPRARRDLPRAAAAAASRDERRQRLGHLPGTAGHRRIRLRPAAWFLKASSRSFARARTSSS